MDKTSLTARDVIEAIADNLVEGLEPLVTKVLAPSIYEVRLHADDLDRFRGILDEIESQARDLLDDRLRRLNRGPIPDWVPFKRQRMRYESAEGDWYITFQEDPDGTLEPGTLEVVSELATEPQAEYGGSAKTQLISTTRWRGRSKTRKIKTDSSRVYAKLTFQDDRGKQLYQMTKKQVVIGRGAADAWTDLRLHTKADVSRQHARIKYEPDADRFFIQDLSTFGTTVDGERVESGVETVDGEERHLDRWSELPDSARLNLANVIDLDFERVVET